MEGPSSSHPQLDETSRGEMPIQQNERELNIIPTSNPPSLPGASTEMPNKLSFVPTTPATNKKQLATSSKVAIPRQRSGVAPRYNRRVPRACESCRHRKTKCSGDTPICRQCKELRISCRYPESWREKTKGQLDKLSSKVSEFEHLLKEVGGIVDLKTSERIKSLLERHSGERDSSSTDPQSNSVTPQEDLQINDNYQDEPSSPSSIGSLEAIDRVEEDLNRNEYTRATGYMGKNSEVTWMHRLRREAEQRARKEPGTYETEHEGEFALHAMNYHLDDMDISIEGPVNVYWMPPRQLADKLFDDYLTSVHPFFPIISRTLFCAQYTTFFDSAARPGDKWLAILNMIFAISAKHAHLSQAPWCGEEHDHLLYLTRARILSMNGDVLFSHPDLQQVQVEGLISFYLLASDQINRAWRIGSLAVRSAITLGINMKNTSEGTSSIAKEARYRVWWCIYTFEHMLGIMTGRPTCILDGVCTAPLPLPFEEEQLRDPMAVKLLDDLDLRAQFVGSAVASSYVHQTSLNPRGGRTAKSTDNPRDAAWLKSLSPSPSLCYLYYTDLAVICQEIVNRVYSPDCAMTPWAHIENRIGELRARIDQWFSSLPESFDFSKRGEDMPDVLRGKLFLAFHYYSARITLGRPCLCRRDAHQAPPDQKPTFSHEMAVISLDSAMRMIDLIPDDPNAIQLYQMSPWWCVLHYLMQAATVLLLELSFGSIHTPDEETNILIAAKKAIRWLYSMSLFSTASRRAWQLCDSNLRRIAIGMDYDISDMPMFVYESKPKRPIDANLLDSRQSNFNSTANPVFQNGTFDPRPHDASQYSQTVADYPGLQTPDLLSTSHAEVPTGGDAYFPYDPISGDFIRSFFPTSTEEEPWNQRTWDN